jgi:uncharacterized protein YcbX
VSVAVCGLAVTPVKATRLMAVDSIVLERDGAVGNRRFFVVDERDRMVNSKMLGELQTVVASCSDRSLSLRFPGGAVVEGEVVHGPLVRTRFFSVVVDAHVLEGPWADALSELVGRPVRLVEPDASAVDRGPIGAASLISRASLSELAAHAGVPSVDARRFRMLIEIDGIGAHEEDRWVGSVVDIGDAAVRFEGHVGRCLITSRDPDTGVVDLPTLDILGEYRSDVAGTEPLPFGVYGSVVTPGMIRVGDSVSLRL